MPNADRLSAAWGTFWKASAFRHDLVWQQCMHPFGLRVPILFECAELPRLQPCRAISFFDDRTLRDLRLLIYLETDEPLVTARSLYILTLFMLAILLGRLRHLPHCCPFRLAW